MSEAKQVLRKTIDYLKFQCTVEGFNEAAVLAEDLDFEIDSISSRGHLRMKLLDGPIINTTESSAFILFWIKL